MAHIETVSKLSTEIRLHGIRGKGMKKDRFDKVSRKLVRVVFNVNNKCDSTHLERLKQLTQKLDGDAKGEVPNREGIMNARA